MRPSIVCRLHIQEDVRAGYICPCIILAYTTYSYVLGQDASYSYVYVLLLPARFLPSLWGLLSSHLTPDRLPN
jgi:hypothetical protein